MIAELQRPGRRANTENHDFGDRLLSLAAGFEGQQAARGFKQEQKLADAAERCARRIIKNLPAILMRVAQQGGRQHGICFMYIDRYGKYLDRAPSELTPHQIAKAFGDACLSKIRALSSKLDVQLRVEQWGKDSAYPQIKIRW